MLRIPFVLIVLCCLAETVGCSYRPNSAIVVKFRDSGGGDAATADVASINRWLLNHKDLTVELYNMCQPLFTNPPDANWPLSDEGKICQAAVNMLPVKFRSDGVKF